MSSKTRAKIENRLARIEWALARMMETGREPNPKLLAMATEMRVRLGN